jgi:FkbM family methyltransferase
MLVKTKTGVFLMLVPGDKGISSELLRWRIHEPFFTSKLLRTVPRGGIVLDIGSNIGYYAVHEAMLVGPEGMVIAVEPQPHVYKALLASFRANGIKNYIAVRKALSSKSGSTEFIVSNFSNWSRIAEGGEAVDMYKINVKVSSVDELMNELGLQKLDLVRMDVEGHEEEILEGMRSTIKRFRPIIFMELHISCLGLEKSIKLLARLCQRGYRIQFAAPRLIDYYPFSRFTDAIYPRGDIRQQLKQIFELVLPCGLIPGLFRLSSLPFGDSCDVFYSRLRFLISFRLKAYCHASTPLP